MEFEAARGGVSTPERFHIRKPRALVKAYERLARSMEGCNVVELGLAQGGSAALLAVLGRPARLVSIELDSEPITPLTRFIAERDLTDHLRPYYGVDQADRSRLLEIVAGELGSEPLDLVLDDASHLLGPTRDAFEALFPLVRPGAQYLIEDWNWQQLRAEKTAQAVEAAAGDESSPRHDAALAAVEEALRGDDVGSGSATRLRSDPDALPRLILELTLARASSGDVVEEIRVGEWWVAVTRGPARLDPAEFSLDDWYTDPLGLLVTCDG